MASTRRIWLRRLGISLGVLALIVVVALLALGRYVRAAVSAEELETLLNDALVSATDGLYTLTLEEIDWGSTGVSPRLHDVSVMLDPEVLAARDAAGTLPDLIFQLQHATVDVTGVDPWRLLRGRGLRAYSIEIDGPLIQLSGLEDLIARGRRGADAESDDEPAVVPVAQETPATPEAAPGPSEPPRIRIARVRLNDAELESYRRQEADTGDIRDTFQLYESFRGVHIALDDLDFTNPDPRRLLFADDFRLEVQEYYYLWPDGLHVENHGPIRLSTRAGSIEVHNFDMQPQFDRREHVADDGSSPRSRTIKIREAAILGIDFAELLADRAFRAETLRMSGADMQIVGDVPTPNAEAQGTTSQVTAPLTSARPGALLTDVLAGLPSVEVADLLIQDWDFEFLVDRYDDGSWRETPDRYYGIDGLEFELQGYRSGPDVDFDVSRPLFADAWSVGAAAITLTVGGDGPHRVAMNNWRSTSAAADLVVDSLEVVPLFDRRDLEPVDGELPDAQTVSTGPVVLTGINYGSLIEAVDVEIDRVTVTAPNLSTVGGEGNAAPAPRPQIGGRAPAEAISAILLGFPNVRVGDVDLEDARWEKFVDRVDGEWLDEPVRRILVDDFDMQLDLVAHQAGAGYQPGRPLLSETAEASIGSVVFAPGDGFEELTVTGVAVSSGRHDLTIEAVQFTPTTEDLPTLVDRVQRQTLANVETGRITVQGRILGNYVDTGEWEADLIEVQAPLVQLYETVRPPDADAAAGGGGDNTQGLADTLTELGLVHVNEIVIRDGVYERRQAPPGFGWEEIPPPVETVQNLDLTIRGFDTDPALGARRLLLSEGVELTADEVATPLGEEGGSLALREFALSSDAATLQIGGALLSTRSVNGDNDFEFGAIELDNVPYGRLFRSLVEPRYSGTTPVIAAMVDRDFRLRIDGLRGSLDNGARVVDLGSIAGAAATGELRVTGLDFHPASRDADPATPEIELADSEYVFTTDAVDLRGVDYVALAETGALIADSLTVAPPSLAVVRNGADPEAEPEPAAAATRPPAEAIRDALHGFPEVAIGRLEINDITLRETRALGGEPVREFTDIDLAIDELDLRPDRSPDDARGLLYASDIRLDMPRQRTWLDNTIYEVEVGPISVSTGRQRVDLGAFAYVPPFDEERFLTRTAIREGDRVEVTAGNLSLDGVDLRQFLADRSVHIETVTLTDWQISILSDKHKPQNPNPGIAWYPHENVQAMGTKFAVDEVVLQNGAVRYSERHREGTRVGSIWWDRLQGRLTNLSNDPERMTLETPAVLSVSARMFDEAFLNLEWRLPLLEPGPTMSYRGEMSPIRAERLSAILEPLEGLRITDGTVDQASFHVDITNSHATGEFVALYRDLGLQIVDRNTGGRNLGRRLLSIAAGVIMPHNNRDAVGRPARVGKIDWVPAPEDPFFKVFWVAVRAGVLDLVMP